MINSINFCDWKNAVIEKVKYIYILPFNAGIQ